MGDYCAFYDRAGASPRHLKHAHPKPPTSYITLQSAQNPKWYMGFGPNTKRARRNLGLNFYRGIIPISLPRKMKRGRVRHLKKCDFRFVLGIFNPMTTTTAKESEKIITDDTSTTTKTKGPDHQKNYFSSQFNQQMMRPESSSSNWDGLFKQIEASRGSQVMQTNRNEVQEDDDNVLPAAAAASTDLNSNNFGGKIQKSQSSSSSSLSSVNNVRSKISQRASFTLQQLLRRNGNHSPSPRISTP